MLQLGPCWDRGPRVSDSRDAIANVLSAACVEKRRRDCKNVSGGAATGFTWVELLESNAEREGAAERPRFAGIYTLTEANVCGTPRGRVRGREWTQVLRVFWGLPA